MTDFTLVIGNRTYSSWSLRGWLALAVTGAGFEEVMIPLNRPETPDLLKRWAPAEKVPVLWHGDLAVWDSLAIVEYLAELFPEAGLLPRERTARAVCRSAMAEMHSGFPDLRREMPMDIRSRHEKTANALVQDDIDWMCWMWRDCRARFAGQDGADEGYLFGRFTAADVFYAPVATRYRTYGVALPDDAQAYVDRLLAHPQMQQWMAAAAEEPWVIDCP